MTDEDIRAMLAAAGIPREAMSTTLLRAGYKSVREALLSPAIVDTPVFYVNAGKSRDNGETLFYLIVKEALLSSPSPTYCADLIDMQRALIGEAEDNEIRTLQKARIIALRNFVDSGPCPFTPYDITYMSSFLYKKVRDGAMLILHLPESTAVSNWWPTSFVSFVSRKSYGVVAK